MIVISHRLSSLVNSDAILVLERGKVAAIGRHEELLESCEIYSGLWHQQNRHLSPGKAEVVSLRARRSWLARLLPPRSGSSNRRSMRSVTRTSRSASALRFSSLPQSFLVGAVILTLARVDRVISSTGGKIVSVDAPLVLQALDPSIVKSIDVREGEVVEKGRLLATLDPTFAVADVNQLQQQIDSLNAQITREEAELAHADLGVPADNGPELGRRYENLQKQLFDQRAAQYSAQLESFDQKIALTQATIDKYQNDETRYRERLGIASEVETHAHHARATWQRIASQPSGLDGHEGGSAADHGIRAQQPDRGTAPAGRLQGGSRSVYSAMVLADFAGPDHRAQQPGRGDQPAREGERSIRTWCV